MSPSVTQVQVQAIEADLVEVARLVVHRLERALQAYGRGDLDEAARVIAEDDLTDDLCLSIEAQVFRTQLLRAPVGREQRVLHVARIACIALERVGDLASAIARLATRMPAGWQVDAASDEHIAVLSDLALGSMTAVHGALTEPDPRLAARNRLRARVAARRLDALVHGVARAHLLTASGTWPARTVLMGRHLERVVNNAKDIAIRLELLEGPPARARQGS